MTQGWTHDRDSGAPAYGNGGTNPKVDFVWGNMPQQPDDDRIWAETPLAGPMDSHDISLDEYQGYPGFAPNTGRTFTTEGPPSFKWPTLGVCYYGGSNLEQLKLKNVVETLISCGVNPELMTDFTFSDGNNVGDKYDRTGTPNYDGSIFWNYIDPREDMGVDMVTGYQWKGSDFDQVVIYSAHNPGTIVPANGAWYDYAIIVLQTSNPNNNTANWW